LTTLAARRDLIQPCAFVDAAATLRAPVAHTPPKSIEPAAAAAAGW
jgi:hypothetical protein